MAKKKSSSKNKDAVETTSQSIQQDIEQFLKNGGKINEIQRGISGVDFNNRSKHITISSQKK